MRPAIVLAAPLLEACCDPMGSRAECCEIAVPGAVLVYDPAAGRFDVRRESGEVVLDEVHAEIVLDALDGAAVRTDDGRDRSDRREEGEDALGKYERIVVEVSGDGELPALEWRLTGYDDGSFTFELDAVNDTGAPIAVARTVPVDAEALYLGEDPARHRVLEDGSWGLFDHYVEVVPGDVERNDAWAGVSPGAYPGSSVSNWNHVVVDLDGGTTWAAGALTFRATTPVVELSAEGSASAPAEDGRAPFTMFRCESAWLPHPKPVETGDRLASETFYVHPSEDDPFEAVERYAGAVARNLGITTWTARGERVPNGWNSWTGSSSTGGYGTDIDEAIVLANLGVMERELRDFGVEWFQVDDGWQVRTGDWEWNTDRFPSGPEGIASAIRKAGFRPGLWISPFTLDPGSETAVAHPDWLADKTALGMLVTGDTEILDLTHPDALAFVQSLGEATREWGFDWLKADFGYLALFGDGFYDPDKTREEAWRAGMGALREGLGPDAFLLGVAIMGLNWGLVDGDRVTLDNTPAWDWQPEVDWDEPESQQGFKPTMRTVARRYWMNGPLWVNHPDLILFRSNTADPSWPEITFEESRSFATFVGLSGGIVKLGDKLVDLEPAELDVIRRLLPIDGRSARPIDLFDREFPEQWHLRLEGGQDGCAEEWDVVGLMNLGWNLDLGTEPYSEIPDDGEPRLFEVGLADLGLDPDRRYLAWEFWTGSFLGEVDGTLAIEVPAHDSRVVAIRARTGAPQFLGWNRQIAMGGTLLEAADWDPSTGALTVRARVVPGTETAPFTWHLAFYVPDGFALSEVGATGAAVSAPVAVRDGEVLDLTFDAEEVGTVELALRFEGGP